MNERDPTSTTGTVEDGETGEPAAVVGAKPPAPDSSPLAPPPIVYDEERPVDPRSVRLARIIGISTTLLIATVPLIVLTLARVLGGMPNAGYLLLLGVLLLLVASFVTLAYRWPAARHERLRYRVEADGLHIRRGVLWRKVICIPISRIQHTDVSQGPVQRSFELATLTVHTAGTEGASISLAGLEHGIASRLCDHLRPGRVIDGN